MSLSSEELSIMVRVNYGKMLLWKHILVFLKYKILFILMHVMVAVICIFIYIPLQLEYFVSYFKIHFAVFLPIPE